MGHTSPDNDGAMRPTSAEMLRDNDQERSALLNGRCHRRKNSGVGARVSASPKDTPGPTRAPHTPPFQGRRRLCTLLMLELSVSATSGVPTPVKSPRRGGWRVGWRLPMNGRPTANPARLAKKIFVLLVPKAPFSSREENDVQPLGRTDRLGQARAELRLRILRSMPPRHQRYLFEEIRKVCREFLRNRGVPSSELTPEELLSEIWQKLLGTVSVGSGEAIDGDLAQVSIDPDVPERDGRVV